MHVYIHTHTHICIYIIIIIRSYVCCILRVNDDNKMANEKYSFKTINNYGKLIGVVKRNVAFKQIDIISISFINKSSK